MQTNRNHQLKTRKIPLLAKEKAVGRGKEMKQALTAEEMVAKGWGEERDKDKVAVRGKGEDKVEKVGRGKVKCQNKC